MVIDWDEEFMVPTNTHTYYMNLTEANANPTAEPVWSELHDMLEEYSIKDMSPSNMKDFTERMYNDPELGGLYNWNRDRRGSARTTPPLHDNSFLCLQATETFEKDDCYGSPHIQPISSLDVTSYFEMLIADWITLS
jgi:hypothetical protein